MRLCAAEHRYFPACIVRKPVMTLSGTDMVRSWLARFEERDQETARELIDAILEVSYSDFMGAMRTLIVARSKEIKGTIGLYAEREVKVRLGIPNKLFKESSYKPRRAFGASIPPISPLRAYAPEVGSEGLVAQLITELCREFPNLFLNHPGPDAIRKRIMCAVQRHGFPAGANPARQLSFQPVAIGAVVKVTKRLKPPV